MKINIVSAAPARSIPDVSCYYFEKKQSYHLKSSGPQIPSNKRPVNLLSQDNRLVMHINIDEIIKNYELDEARRICGSTALRQAKKTGGNNVCWFLNGSVPEETFTQLITGALLFDYRFTDYFSKPKSNNGNEMVLTIVAGKNTAAFKQVLKRASQINEGVSCARDLANIPASDLVPEDLANYARNMAKSLGLQFKHLTATQLKAQGYVGLTAVGGGSANPPVMFTLTYTPKKVRKGAKPICFVGKGITFDSGGICIKPGANMWMMKADMHGAATVVGAMKAIALLKPDVPVTGVIAAAENMPDGKAYRPSDVLRYKNGLTVEIHNTDAEGRLVLADALIYAQRTLKQKRIVDFATLTGACARALGSQYIGLMSRYPDLSDEVKAAALASGEGVWELPLHIEYRAMLDSKIADTNHMGGPIAGAQTAGWFLHKFIEEGTEYVHLDIAGTMLAEREDKYWGQVGASGTGVRLAVSLVS